MIRRTLRIPLVATKYVRPVGAFSRSHRFLSQASDKTDKNPEQEQETETEQNTTISQKEIEQLEERAIQLAEELELWKKETARIQADAYNHAERLKKDKKNAEVYAIKRFAKDILPVVDVLEKAVAIEDQTFEQLLEGVQLTLKNVHGVMDKHNVTKIPSMGEMFSPSYHEVMFQFPHEEPNGTIIQVIQEGYRLGDQTLRGAKVGISSGPADDSDV